MIGTRGAAQPADVTQVRATNLAIVLRYVRAHAPCSRAEIAAATGLNKATVSSLVTDLLQRRLLRETGLAGNRIGRPAAMLTLESQPYAAIGLEVSANELSAVAVDLTGTRLLSWRRSWPGFAAPPGRAVAAIAALAGRVVTKVTGQGRQVLGLTVAVPGPVSAGGGVHFAPYADWPELDLRAQLSRALRQPGYEVTVESAASLAAQAEQRDGGHAGTGDLVYLLGGVSVSAGVIADGRPLRGGRGLAGAIGHLRVDPAGPACACGRTGCLDAFAGLPALIRRALPDTEADGPVDDYAPELERIVALARGGDPDVVAALTETGTRLGVAVAVVADLLDPTVILLGGAFAPLAPWLLPAVAAEAGPSVTVGGSSSGIVDRPLVAAATLDPNAVALAGAALTLTRLEAGQLPAAW